MQSIEAGHLTSCCRGNDEYGSSQVASHVYGQSAASPSPSSVAVTFEVGELIFRPVAIPAWPNS